MKKLSQKDIESNLLLLDGWIEKNNIKGITVPGMPAGTNVPGMETIDERAKFDVLAVNLDGSTFIWKQYE